MEIIQTIIALTLIYLVLSLLASGVQEIISMQQELRAKQLKKSILLILKESDLFDNNGEKYNVGDVVSIIDDDIDNIVLCAKKQKTESSFEPTDGPKKIKYVAEEQTLLPDINNNIKYCFYFEESPTTDSIEFKNQSYKLQDQLPLEKDKIYYINDKEILQSTSSNIKKVELLTEKIYKSSFLRSANQKDVQILSLIFPHFFSNIWSILLGAFFIIINLFIFIGNGVVRIQHLIQSEKTQYWKYFKYRKNEKGIQRNLRKSEGFSYINPPDLFGKALLEVIQNELPEGKKFNSSDTLDTITTKLSFLNFYSPALCEIKQIINSIKNNRLFNFKAIKNNRLLNITPRENSEVINLINALNDIFIVSQKRVRGTYSRNSKLLSFCIGLAIAALFNADTLYMFRHLSQNTVNPSGDITSSLEECKEDEDINDCLQKNIPNINAIFSSNYDSFPLGWQFSLKANSSDADLSEKLSHDEQVEAYNQLSSFQESLNSDKNKNYKEFSQNYRKLMFDIAQMRTNQTLTQNFGRYFQDFDKKIKEKCPKSNFEFNTCNEFIETSIQQIARSGFDALTQSNQKNNLSSWSDIHNNIKVHQGGLPLAAFGWLITALAISMGAPFWFDLLFKILKFRAPSPETNSSLVDDSRSSSFSGFTQPTTNSSRTTPSLEDLSRSNPMKPQEITGPGIPPPPPDG